MNRKGWIVKVAQFRTPASVSNSGGDEEKNL